MLSFKKLEKLQYKCELNPLNSLKKSRFYGILIMQVSIVKIGWLYGG